MDLFVVRFILYLFVYRRATFGSLSFEEDRERLCDNEEPCRAPKIKFNSLNITASVGETIELTCVARGNPLPNVTWAKNEIPITELNRNFVLKNEKVRLKVNGPFRLVNSTLKINDILKTDFGFYKCVAQNVKGTSSSSNALITKKSRKSNLLQPENVPGSSKYKGYSETQQCVTKLNSTACAAFLDSTKLFFTDETTPFKLLMLSKIAEFESSKSFFSQRCRGHAISFLCFYNLPYCQNSPDSKPKKMDVCQQDCLKLSTDYCQSEFLRAKEDNELKLYIPYNCSTLSKENCITIFKESLPIHKAAPNGVEPKYVNVNDHCYFGKGEFYRGVINRSETNLKCFDWSLTIEGKKYPSYLAGHNYCRNLGKVKDRPWCYVVDESRKMFIEYCNVPRCADAIHPQVTSIWYTIIPCLIFSFVVSLVIISLAWRRHKKHYYQSPPHLPVQIFPRVSPKILEIDRADLCDFRLLGDGSLGCVYSADYTGNKDGKTFTGCVAVKSIINKALPKQIEDFVREAETRSNFKHENVIALIGVISKEEPLSLIYEFTEFGDLHEYLLRHSPNFSDAHANDNCEPLEFSDLLAISTQIANGMAYLSSHAFVHKDLAVRNCLVAENGIIKISDFSGLSDMYASDYLRSTEHPPLPIRWMSPESLSQLISSSNCVSFSSASDIWSYGVVLWEIFSYGSRPYFGLSNAQCMQLIMDFKLLPCPPGCSSAIYNIMIECWAKDTSMRCGFIEICSKLKCYGDMVSHNKNSRHSSNSLQSTNSVQRSANSLQSHRSDFSVNNNIAMHTPRNGNIFQYPQHDRPMMNLYSREKRTSSRESPTSQVGHQDFEFMPLSSLPRSNSRQPPPSFVSSYYPPSMNCPPASAVLSRPSNSSHCSSSCSRSGRSCNSPSVPSSCANSSHIYL